MRCLHAVIALAWIAAPALSVAQSPARDAGGVPRTPDAGTPSSGADGATPGASPGAGPGPPAFRDAGRSDGGAELAPLPEDRQPEVFTKLRASEELQTGDSFELVIHVEGPADDEISVPKQSLEPFEILDKRARTRALDGGRRRHVLTLDLLALRPGNHTLGPIRIRVVTADGTIGAVTTNAIDVGVGSVLANEPGPEPKPASKPVQVHEEDYTLLWIAAGVAAIALTAFLTLLAARWWRRRQRAAEPAPPPRPPWDIAVEKLERLQRDRQAALAEGRVVEWVDGLSDALREYLGYRYGFEGLESTTDEVARRLRNRRLYGLSVPEITAVLGECDLVKFAKATLDESRCDALLDSAFRIVRATTPGAETQAAAAAGSVSSDPAPAGSRSPGAPPADGGNATGAEGRRDPESREDRR